MNNAEFANQFKDQLARIQMFFYSRIKRAGIKDNASELVEDLISETIISVLQILKDNKYPDYDLKALINLKANNIWAHFISNNMRADKAKDPATEIRALEVLIDPGTAPYDEIASILVDLSILFRKMEGSGIEFKLNHITLNSVELI